MIHIFSGALVLQLRCWLLGQHATLGTIPDKTATSGPKSCHPPPFPGHEGCCQEVSFEELMLRVFPPPCFSCVYFTSIFLQEVSIASNASTESSLCSGNAEEVPQVHRSVAPPTAMTGTWALLRFFLLLHRIYLLLGLLLMYCAGEPET